MTVTPELAFIDHLTTVTSPARARSMSNPEGNSQKVVSYWVISPNEFLVRCHTGIIQ